MFMLIPKQTIQVFVFHHPAIKVKCKQQSYIYIYMSKRWTQGYGSNNNAIFIPTIYPGLVYMLDRVFLFMLSRLKHVWYATGIFIYDT